MLTEKLKNVDKKYRPAPFWSWNEKLSVEETALQVREMEEAGLGGYFMHARGGLLTDYLSDEWFDNIKAAVDTGEKLGMQSWGYDENGWPSGFGSGAVNGLGEEYQQKYLRFEIVDAPKNTERTIINLSKDGKIYHFYYDVNEFYVDTLDKKVTVEFLRSTHEKYRDTLKGDYKKMRGFFTDEPQVSRNGIPWSLIMEKEYMKRYGKTLSTELTGLFFETENYREVRYNFWKLVRDLFAENYMGTIYDWCRENNTLLTGHLVLEEGYSSHILANGSCMAPYEYMDIPGMDHLGRRPASIQTEMQVSSVANQLGKKQILSETFALCGWNVSFEELRMIYEQQMVRGINYLCQHLEGYTLRGIRKRDYPATLFKQQPWWKYWRTFNDAASRIGYIIAEGKTDYDILVLNTVESAWLRFNNTDYAACSEETYLPMINVMNRLESENLQYHLGDARIIERYGKADGNTFTVGTQNYGIVIVPGSTVMAKHTLKLLKKFKSNGGAVLFVDAVPEYVDGIKSDELTSFAAECQFVTTDTLTDNIPESFRKMTVAYSTDDRNAEPVFTCRRRFDDEKLSVYYLVNPGNAKDDVVLTVPGNSATIFDAVSGEEKCAVYEKNGDDISVSLSLPRLGSAVVFAYDEKENLSAEKKCTALSPLELKGDWEIAESDDNVLTLDYCDLKVNGETVGVGIPVSDVQEILCAYEKKVKAEVTYRFTVKEKKFSHCELVIETPEIFDIFVNGEKVVKPVNGYFRDKSFKTVDIAEYVKNGINEVTTVCDFCQREETYEKIRKSPVFESEKNKLSYDMEIEAVYIKGDFGVKTGDRFTAAERRATVVNGRFEMTERPSSVKDGDIVLQGFPFFAGEMTFKKTVTLRNDELSARSVRFSKLPSTVTEVKINGKTAGTVMWEPYEVDVSGLIKEGENTIEITVTGNLRNMLGPFHLKEGESYAVGPRAFFHNSPIWQKGVHPDWVDRYCFVEFGLFF